MEHLDFAAAIRQLSAAADLLASKGPQEWRLDAFGSIAVFRRYDPSRPASQRLVTSNDALFIQTAAAALTMAGRNEFAASHALIAQACSLLRDE
jgi:hypothetical protein